ncbi:cell division protein FtsL [Bacillus sp. USDA818B3_A]|uniref:cell division protein FtsL n=1 Tax=Bacillus sp. USDA818B3_A TaxID=2698834 RepID=UPI00136F3F50|nr:cell division protein FtsL [Bacillus sp. USDA818B3_A]
MSNLARKVSEQQQQQVEQSVQNKRQVKIKKYWLTPGEKIIGVVFAGMVCFGATHIISTQSKLYEANKQLQMVQGKINEQEKVNEDLQVQVSQLSSYDRIFAKAKEMGLIKDENNVKVVQQK